jgi:hypothetical protein
MTLSHMYVYDVTHPAQGRSQNMWKKPILVVLWYYTNIHFGGLKNVRDTAGFARN